MSRYMMVGVLAILLGLLAIMANLVNPKKVSPEVQAAQTADVKKNETAMRSKAAEQEKNQRKKMQEQFPVALDVFVRGLRAGHPIAAALDLLTVEMPDPIGSQFGRRSGCNWSRGL